MDGVFEFVVFVEHKQLSNSGMFQASTKYQYFLIMYNNENWSRM